MLHPAGRYKGTLHGIITKTQRAGLAGTPSRRPECMSCLRKVTTRFLCHLGDSKIILLYPHCTLGLLWFCALCSGIIPDRTLRPYQVSGMELGPAVCKASPFTPVLDFWPSKIIFKSPSTCRLSFFSKGGLRVLNMALGV